MRLAELYHPTSHPSGVTNKIVGKTLVPSSVFILSCVWRRRVPACPALPARATHQVCVLLQTLSQSFMANPAAAHGLSAALAPPASAVGGAAPGARNGVNAGVAAAAAGGGPGSGSARGNASQHTISVSLGKAWLEILVKLMRRAGEGGVAAAAAAGGGSTGESAVVAAALEDPATRDALLVLFERTAAGVAAAATAAAATGAAATGAGTNGGALPAAAAVASSSLVAGAGSGAASAAGDRKALAWADPALVLRSLVLLREVLVRVPDAYVVPLRRRGVLHRLVTPVCNSLSKIFARGFVRGRVLPLHRLGGGGCARCCWCRNRKGHVFCSLGRFAGLSADMPPRNSVCM